MYNVKFLFLAISLIHQLTTAKVQRRMSEGLAKESQRAGAAEYVTKDNRPRELAQACSLCPIQNS